MAVTTGTIIDTLNHLIEICRDGERGYQVAAEKEKDGSLKALYTQFSNQRTKIISELKAEVKRLGGNPDHGGTAAGNLHRGWLTIRAAATGDSSASIASECERGEDAAVHAYEEALEHELPPEVLQLVQRQFVEIKEAHDRVREVRDNESDSEAS